MQADGSWLWYQCTFRIYAREGEIEENLVALTSRLDRQSTAAKAAPLCELAVDKRLPWATSGQPTRKNRQGVSVAGYIRLHVARIW